MLSSCADDITDFAVVDPDINFSDHLPLRAVINTDYVVVDPGSLSVKGESKPIRNLLRWDKLMSTLIIKIPVSVFRPY